MRIDAVGPMTACQSPTLAPQASYPMPDPTSTPTFPLLTVAGPWQAVLHHPAAAALEQVLPDFMRPRRWFGAKARTIRAAALVDTIPVADLAQLAIIRVDFAHGPPESYALPLTFAAGDDAAMLRWARPQAIVAELSTAAGFGVLYDAVWEPRFCQALLDLITTPQRVPGVAGALVTTSTRALARLYRPDGAPLPPQLLGVEQSNTSVRYGDRLILKLFRRLETGINPDVEIGRFLTEQTDFANVPPLAGVMEYLHRLETAQGELGQESAERPADDGAGATALAILQGFVPNQGDAWRFTLDSLSDYFDRVLAHAQAVEAPPALPQDSLLTLARQPLPEHAAQVIGAYLSAARLLGQRTAELHLALASGADDPAFAPELFDTAFQSVLRQEMYGLSAQIMALLRSRLAALSPAAQPEATTVLSHEQEIARRFDVLVERPIHALRTRIHGDYHLGQVLYTGQDFMIIDFEGEPARPLAARREKRSPLQDVAGMLRSFHYAAYAAFFDRTGTAELPPAQLAALERWTRYWHAWVSVAFLQTYLHVAGDAPFVPVAPADLRILLDAFLLEKAVYELGYELNNRPDWVKIPLQGILHTLATAD